MGKALASRARSRKAFLMNGTPQSKLDPRVKNVWRVNDAIWIVLGYLLLSSYRVLTVSIEPFRMRCSYWLGRYVGMCPGAYSDPAKETDSLPHSGRFAD